MGLMQQEVSSATSIDRQAKKKAGYAGTKGRWAPSSLKCQNCFLLFSRTHFLCLWNVNTFHFNSKSFLFFNNHPKSEKKKKNNNNQTTGLIPADKHEVEADWSMTDIDLSQLQCLYQSNRTRAYLGICCSANVYTIFVRQSCKSKHYPIFFYNRNSNHSDFYKMSLKKHKSEDK